MDSTDGSRHRRRAKHPREMAFCVQVDEERAKPRSTGPLEHGDGIVARSDRVPRPQARIRDQLGERLDGVPGCRADDATRKRTRERRQVDHVEIHRPDTDVEGPGLHDADHRDRRVPGSRDRDVPRRRGRLYLDASGAVRVRGDASRVTRRIQSRHHEAGALGDARKKRFAHDLDREHDPLSDEERQCPEARRSETPRCKTHWTTKRYQPTSVRATRRVAGRRHASIPTALLSRAR